MTSEQQERLAYLWAKCCDIRQPMSEQEMGEFVELLEVETEALDRVEM